MAEPWLPYALKEIDLGIRKGKRPTPWELKFLKTLRPRIESGIGLTEKQMPCFLMLHQRMTEPVRIKWR